jgi:hypothetical protein
LTVEPAFSQTQPVALSPARPDDPYTLRPKSGIARLGVGLMYSSFFGENFHMGNLRLGLHVDVFHSAGLLEIGGEFGFYTLGGLLATLSNEDSGFDASRILVFDLPVNAFFRINLDPQKTIAFEFRCGGWMNINAHDPDTWFYMGINAGTAIVLNMVYVGFNYVFLLNSAYGRYTFEFGLKFSI